MKAIVAAVFTLLLDLNGMEGFQFVGKTNTNRRQESHYSLSAYSSNRNAASSEFTTVESTSEEDSMHSLALDDFATLPAVASRQVQARSSPTIQTWARRLITREDFMSLHKISCGALCVTSVVILGAGACTGFQEMPEWMKPFDLNFALSAFTCALTSIPMAISHRQNQPKVRDQFISQSVTTIFQLMLVEFYSPWAPAFFDYDNITRPILVGLIVLQIIYLGEAVKFKEDLLLAPLADRKGTSISFGLNLGRQGSEAAFSSLINLTMLPLVVFLAFLLDPAHDRQWFLEFAQSHAGSNAFYYETVYTTFTLMMGIFVTTLRDKKLVSTDVLDAFNLGTMITMTMAIVAVCFSEPTILS